MGFDQLSLDRLFGVLDVEVADQLLSDGRGALDRLSPCQQILPGGARDPGWVERAVVEEVLVLDRDRGVLEVLRQRGRGHGLADVVRADEADQSPVGGVDRRRAALLDRLQARQRRRRVVDVQRPGGGDAAGDRDQPGDDRDRDRELMPAGGGRLAPPPANTSGHRASDCNKGRSSARTAPPWRNPACRAANRLAEGLYDVRPPYARRR